ncbi:MAG: glutamine synthetase family protein [Thermomicrobiales bacterium]
MSARGMLSVEQLRQLVAEGAIDTVVNAICDMQGRLMGKRVSGDFFVEHCIEHGTHFCVYLLGTEMEMQTPEGYAAMNWEMGYGDWQARPDWGTLRVIPWLEKTALVLSDVVDEATGEVVAVAPRTILRRQIARAAERGLRLKMASELEFYLLDETFEGVQEKGFQGVRRFGWYNEDYHLLQGTKAEPFYRQLRNQLSAAGVPIEFTKGEAAPGQHEINFHYADALEAADRHALLKHGAKEMAWQHGRSLTFMAKPDHTWTGSSSHVHLSAWDAEGARNLFFDPEGQPYGMSETMRHFLGGLIACAPELSLFAASNVNSYKRYAIASWAPTGVAWGRDNRTCGFRIVGHGSSLRIENRIPGADANSYLAYAACIAAGLHGIERRIEPPAEYRGNAYAATDVPRVPSALYEAIPLWERSAVARAAFGDDVVEHYLNMARVEQRTYDAAVSSWERERYLERG